ncbi:MAG TPA: hypothetical protein VFT05_08785 [Burkholderiaceae bacterium]|jgi:hypothetical protein|nr:hypothetical protein [Burkholderiaceae bacterium]
MMSHFPSWQQRHEHPPLARLISPMMPVSWAMEAAVCCSELACGAGGKAPV